MDHLNEHTLLRRKGVNGQHHGKHRSASMAVSERQIKATLKIPYNSSKMPFIKDSKNNGGGKMESFYSASGNVN